MFTQIFISFLTLSISLPVFAKWDCTSANYLRRRTRCHPAQASFTFDEISAPKSLRALHDLKGIVRVSSESIRCPAKVEGDQVSTDLEVAKDVVYDYFANFSLTALSEKPFYNSEIYRGFSKFEDVESVPNHHGTSMWGDFVLEKYAVQKPVTSLRASYIFQADDDLGGTLDFKCVLK